MVDERSDCPRCFLEAFCRAMPTRFDHTLSSELKPPTPTLIQVCKLKACSFANALNVSIMLGGSRGAFWVIAWVEGILELLNFDVFLGVDGVG